MMYIAPVRQVSIHYDDDDNNCREEDRRGNLSCLHKEFKTALENDAPVTVLEAIVHKDPRVIGYLNRTEFSVGWTLLSMVCQRGISSSNNSTTTTNHTALATAVNDNDDNNDKYHNNNNMADSSCLSLPVDRLIGTFLKLYPQAVRVADDVGSLPIHYACRNIRNISFTTLQKLVQLYPQSLQKEGPLGYTPIHCACSYNHHSNNNDDDDDDSDYNDDDNEYDYCDNNNSDEQNRMLLQKIQFLVHASPSDTTTTLQCKDIFGRTPLHVAVTYDLPLSVIVCLATNNLPALQEWDLDNHSTPLHTACSKSNRSRNTNGIISYLAHAWPYACLIRNHSEGYLPLEWFWRRHSCVRPPPQLRKSMHPTTTFHSTTRARQQQQQQRETLHSLETMTHTAIRHVLERVIFYPLFQKVTKSSATISNDIHNTVFVFHDHQGIPYTVRQQQQQQPPTGHLLEAAIAAVPPAVVGAASSSCVFLPDDIVTHVQSFLVASSRAVW